MQSVDTVDYDLSSSDDEAEAQERDIEDDDLRVRIARDNIRTGISPAKTDLSDAKTSDITKVSQVRDVSGIVHEVAPHVSPNASAVSASQKLDTRSDLSAADSRRASALDMAREQQVIET